MKNRKTYLSMIDELGNLGFINYDEHTRIKARINNRFNGRGYK
jgi:hypothetical protein